MWEALGTLGIWVEAIALIVIFLLDWKERKENRKERQEQNQETAAQLAASQSQVEASRKSAEAATEAALAAKKSADIAAALHQPFMGLSGVMLKGGWGSRYWDIAFTLKNYGTLPALHVSAMFNFLTDNERRAQKTEPESVEIFPSQEFESVVRFDLGVQDQQAVHAETKKLKVEVRIFYQGDGGRHFGHAAQVSYAHSRFVIDNAETR